VHGATQFVGWYNGHPDAADHEYDLSVRRAVVIGNGNVAIDVARMLVLHPDELAPTDTADHAIEVLSQSQVEEVVLLGRRGPAQAAFTNPELRELADLKRAGVEVDVTDLELDEHSARWLEEEADVTARKNVEILRDYAASGPKDESHRIVLRFLRSPVEILGEGEHGPVTGIRVVRNELQPTDDGGLRAVATGDEEVIECGLVLRSIGYRGRPVDDVPFDERRGLIRNTGGRVSAESGDAHRGEYVVGWIKRGPSGVIGTNKKDALDTVAGLLDDWAAGALHADSAEDVAELLPDNPGLAGWKAIDHHERSAGREQRRPRIKVVDHEVLHDLAAGALSTT